MACSGSDDTTVDDTDMDTDTAVPVQVRFATFNVSLFGTSAGQVASTLNRENFAPAIALAATLQEVRPDIVLLNELDYDADGTSVQRLMDNFLSVSQDGREPLDYPHVYIPTVNTGVPSGADLNNSGDVATSVGTNAYAGDSQGFGTYPGQYGMVLLSVYPIDTANIRTFQEVLWSEMPDALLPKNEDGSDWYSEEALDVARVSSKTHADVPVLIEDTVVHVLISHPTPPSFDGDEDRNGRRNHDEIRLWTDYLSADEDGWMVDDNGVSGGLGDGSFVIMGDLNNDPNDGDSLGEAITDLIGHARVAGDSVPASEGAAEQAELQGGVNADHTGPASADTADFRDSDVGNLRLDYVLPSNDMDILDSQVFWPLSSDPLFELVGIFPFVVSDHRLVWVDVEI
ncbi:MAG: 3-phytase [Myxococcota bacterium]|jgi:3-phytase